ncbi:hypothetical protein [Parvibaculum sp.]|uniref:hypothetical protein n=1 Tax=Parvibaculum sp. TaxID=2024848 RepID=UPI00320CD1DA
MATAPTKAARPKDVNSLDFICSHPVFKNSTNMVAPCFVSLWLQAICHGILPDYRAAHHRRAADRPQSRHSMTKL